MKALEKGVISYFNIYSVVDPVVKIIFYVLLTNFFFIDLFYFYFSAASVPVGAINLTGLAENYNIGNGTNPPIDDVGWIVYTSFIP